MQGSTCDVSGCPNPIARRCSNCQGSYCIRHQAPENKRCDNCIASKKRTGGSLMTWGCLMSVGSVLLMFVLVMVLAQLRFGEMTSPTGPILGIGAFVFWVGVVVFLVGAQIRAQSKG